MLVLTMLLLTLLWFTVLMFSRSTIQALRGSNNYLGSERASAAAEAGVLYAVGMLKADSTWRPKAGTAVKLKYSDESFRLWLFESTSAPEKIPSGALYIRSVGSARSGQTRTMASVVKVETATDSPFDYGLFTQTLQVSGGSFIQAFNSKTGLVVSKAAEIATNSTARGSIRLDSGVFVDGTVVAGKGADITSSTNFLGRTWDTNNAIWKNWNVTTTGEKTLQNPIDVPPVQIPAGSSKDPSINVDWRGADLKPGSYKELKAGGGGSARMATGAYYFDTVNISGGATMAAQGSEPVIIYVRDKVNISGGTLSNASRLPRNLIFILGPSAELNISGGSTLYASVYAPQAKVKISGASRLYGSLVGGDTELSGSGMLFHDITLKSDPPAISGLGGSSGSGGGLSVLSWRRF